jgi:alpha-mannosidase
VKRNLPGVKISLGKMEDFSDGIAAEEKNGAKVPVVRTDMPDCWIHGMGSMPAAESLAHQARMELIAGESLDTHLRAWGLPRPDIREILFTAHERSLMYGEHTWGGNRNLQGRNAYADTNFADTVKTDGTCKYLQKTWNDHAAYIEKSAEITDKLIAKELEQLAAAVKVDGDRLVVFNPLPQKRDAIVEIPGKPGKRFLAKDLPPSGYKAFPLNLPDRAELPDQVDSAVLENKFLKVTLDRVKGGIVSIVDKKTGRELVDQKAKYVFGQYIYQRFDRKQTMDYDVGCEHIDAIYGFCSGWNVRADLPGNVPYAEAVPTYIKMSVSKDGIVQTAELSAEAAGIIASKVTTTVTLPENSPWLEIAIRLDDKKPDYWPENGAFFLPVKAEKPQFRVGRSGWVMDPTKDYARGSNRTYGYVNNGAMIAESQSRFPPVRNSQQPHRSTCVGQRQVNRSRSSERSSR